MVTADRIAAANSLSHNPDSHAHVAPLKFPFSWGTIDTQYITVYLGLTICRQCGLFVHRPFCTLTRICPVHIPAFFSVPETPWKSPNPRGSGPHNTWFLGPKWACPKPDHDRFIRFCTIPCTSNTYTQITLLATSVATGRIHMYLYIFELWTLLCVRATTLAPNAESAHVATINRVTANLLVGQNVDNSKQRRRRQLSGNPVRGISQVLYLTDNAVLLTGNIKTQTLQDLLSFETFRMHNYTLCSRKGTTPSNVDRFLKLLHWHILFYDIHISQLDSAATRSYVVWKL